MFAVIPNCLPSKLDFKVSEFSERKMKQATEVYPQKTKILWVNSLFLHEKSGLKQLVIQKSKNTYQQEKKKDILSPFFAAFS